MTDAIIREAARRIAEKFHPDRIILFGSQVKGTADVQLSENIDLEPDENNSEFFGILMNYQLEGRYPDSYPLIPDEIKVKQYLAKTKDMQQWLINKL
ncbi:MAG: hypothetical protein A2W19_02890 [Spirochaetes bacterium RBG_16_49_21]|nr:MAG: hypothetical protein A2W19_02890 [Spirochaetes bacterium RBG_16_49_21]